MRPLARFVRYLDSGLRRYLGSIKVPIPELDGLSTVAKSAYGAALNGDGSVTTFHQCFREMVGLEAAGVLPVHNYIQLIAGTQTPRGLSLFSEAGHSRPPMRHPPLRRDTSRTSAC